MINQESSQLDKEYYNRKELYNRIKDDRWFIRTKEKWSFKRLLLDYVILFFIGLLAYFLHSISSNWWFSDGLFLISTIGLINLIALPVYFFTKSHVVTVFVALLINILTYFWHNADADCAKTFEAKYQD